MSCLILILIPTSLTSWDIHVSSAHLSLPMHIFNIESSMLNENVFTHLNLILWALIDNLSYLRNPQALHIPYPSRRWTIAFKIARPIKTSFKLLNEWIKNESMHNTSKTGAVNELKSLNFTPKNLCVFHHIVRGNLPTSFKCNKMNESKGEWDPKSNNAKKHYVE